MLVRLLKRILVVTRVFDGRLTGLNCVGQEQCVIRSKLLQYCGLPNTDALHFIHPFVSFRQQLRFNLDRSIRGLIDFKVVLQTISNIQSLTISVEIKIKEIQETYNVLEEHQLKVSWLRSCQPRLKWKYFDVSRLARKLRAFPSPV